jgi:hypothetical protein
VAASSASQSSTPLTNSNADSVLLVPQEKQGVSIQYFACHNIAEWSNTVPHSGPSSDTITTLEVLSPKYGVLLFY